MNIGMEQLAQALEEKTKAKTDILDESEMMTFRKEQQEQGQQGQMPEGMEQLMMMMMGGMGQ